MQCEQGVSLGAAEPLSDCVHFPCKDDPADFDADLVSWSRNYATAEQMPEIASELLSEDLACENKFARGPYTWTELLEHLGLPMDTPEPEPGCPYAQLAGGIAVMSANMISMH